VVICGWLLGEPFAGIFMGSLLLTVQVIMHISVSDFPDSKKTGLLLLAIVIILGAISLLSGSAFRAVLYGVGVPVLVALNLLLQELQHCRPSYAQEGTGPPAEPLVVVPAPEDETLRDAAAPGPGSGEAPPGAFGTARQGIAFELVNVSLSLPSGQGVLRNISLTVPPGKAIAVMGPSGCGKSSMTNVLSGRASYGIVTGTIRANGSLGNGRTAKELRSVTGFVPQDDVMHRNMTVEENVRYQAMLRLPRPREVVGIAARGQQVEDAVNRVLCQLGLEAQELRHTLIGDEHVRGVSGGQRKRVSIAMELVAEPSLLFLDEPTSGLDSTTSHSVVREFTNAARSSNCTTLAVVHQPRFETLLQFDRLILLAAGGYLVYSGPTRQVEEYFQGVLGVTFPQKANPADVFLDAISWDPENPLTKEDPENPLTKEAFGTSLAERWSANRIPEADTVEVPLPDLEVVTCTWGEEAFVQMKRAAVRFQRDWQQIFTNHVLMVFGLVIFCVATPEDPESAFFHVSLALFLVMLTQGVAAQRILGGHSRCVVWREAGVRVSTALCFVGCDVAALADVTLSAALFTAVYYSMGPLLSSHHTIYWVSFAFTYAVFGLNYIWSVLMSSDSAQMMAVVSTFMAFLLAGTQPSFADMARLGGNSGIGLNLMAISPLRWAFGALMYDHTIRKDSIFANDLVQELFKQKFEDLAMPVDWVRSRDKPWKCDRSCRERWQGDKSTPRISFVCGVTQLFLLGAFFRALALLCMLVTAQLRAQGGGSLFGAGTQTAEVGRGRGARVWSAILQVMLPCFVVLVCDLHMSILMQTI